MSKKPFLPRLAQHVRVVAQVEQPIDKALGPVGAVDGLRGDAVDGLDQFVVVGVVGERNGMIDAEVRNLRTLILEKRVFSRICG